MRHFIIRYTPPRPTFLTDSTPEENASVERHFVYLQDLLAKDILVMAGRTDDATYGIGVLKAESEASAQKILANDPAVKEGVFKGELKPFRLALFGNE